jgi:hypothetical protein
MTTGRWKMTGWCVALAALGMMTTAPGASAQNADRGCRCVDADGNPIENCSCFVMPDVPNVPRAMVFGRDGDFNFAFPTPPNRPRLGITVSGEQDDAIDAQGARVGSVMEEGPAEEAGLREGDIITAVDGQSLLQPLEPDVEQGFDLDQSLPVQRLLAIASRLEPGESVEVRYLREGQPQTAMVEVQELGAAWNAWARDFRNELQPQMERLRSQMRDQRFDADRIREQVRVLGERDQPFFVGPGLVRYGIRVTELTPGLAEYFGSEEGVLVTDVDDDSTLGLQAGDVILRIGDRDATTPDRVRRLLATYDDGESVSFRVRRRGAEIDVMGRLPD